MTKVAVTAGALALAAVTVVVVPISASTGQAARVIDRTLVCTIGMQAGARVVDLGGASAARLAPDQGWIGSVNATTASPEPGGRTGLAGISAGRSTVPNVGPGGVSFAARLCRSRGTSIDFTTRGLAGGFLGGYGDQRRCFPSGRSVLVRVRVEFARPVRLAPVRRTTYIASGRVLRGQLGVRTQRGKPLAYGHVDASGKARLLTAPGCF